MPQSAEKVLDHAPLFREPEYQEMLARKKAFECGAADAKVQPSRPTGPRAGNTARRTSPAKRWSINPAKACQPLGAVFAAAGFEKTLSFVHGSQGCVAYYRCTCRATSRSRRRRLLVDDRGRGGVRRPATTWSTASPTPTRCTTRR